MKDWKNYLMTNMFLLDTNVVSDLELTSDYPKLASKYRLYWESCSISSIVRLEIMYGLAVMPEGKKKDIKTRNVNLILSRLPVIDFNTLHADTFAKIKADLKKQGKMIEDADIMIAATALANDLVLVTNNTKHFERIEGLKLENWLG